MYQYQQFNRFFAQIAGGLEQDGALELERLGATNLAPVHRGLHFDADVASLYRISYAARLASKILAPLLTFDCHSDRYLYKTASTIDWSDFLGVDDTFAVFANVSNSIISHSKFAALRVKDAVVDQFRLRTGQRPNIDTHDPDLWIGLFINENRAVINVATSGGSMHRRSYRTASVEAPMQETVAAAIIYYSGWDGERPLYDPMCGSGTLLSEALMHYCRIPAGFLRSNFGFERLPDFDREVWRLVKNEMDAQIRMLPEGLIAGSDISHEAIEAARQNQSNLPSGERIALSTSDYRDISSLEDHVIICNPPYGLRLERGRNMHAFYKEFGDFLKQRCNNSTTYIYFGKREYLKDIGLRSSWKKPLVSGALDGRLARFELY